MSWLNRNAKTKVQGNINGTTINMVETEAKEGADQLLIPMSYK